MKKIILLSTVFFCCLQFTIFCSNAQILYGTTVTGGTDGGGALIKFMPANNTLSVVKSFEAPAANPSMAQFVQASDGKLYGMTTRGGSSGVGVIFSFDPLSSTYTKLKDFNGSDGTNPNGSLIQASDGKLYGMTTWGGNGNIGVIFSFDPSSSTYTKLKDFDGTTGAQPFGSLVQANDGKLYGMTAEGGNSNYGVIFSFDPSSSTYTKLLDFNYTNGGYPHGSLIQASDGKLYGMTAEGGSSRVGVIFSFDPFSLTYTKLSDFSRNDANGNVSGSLLQATDGKLYGTTGDGVNDYGVIFSYNILSSKYTKLKDFDLTNGASTISGLMQASDGKLYGMTSGGGIGNAGVIYSFDPSSSTYTKLLDFDGTNGSYADGSLMQASDGKLYGMTSSGGGIQFGVIFSFDPSGHIYKMLKDFGTSEAGYDVHADLIQAADGKLYGMTSRGGSSAYGVIFSFDPSSSTYTKLKDFNGNDGASPLGSLIQASDGKLYGMTTGGGSGDIGVIFSFDPSTSTYTKLKDFDGTTGAQPFGSLMQAKDGKLYGMTTGGGSKEIGVIFSYDPSSSTYTKLKDLVDGVDGAFPQGALMQASDGKLYGTTSSGRNGVGTIFSFDPISLKYITLKRFDNGNGNAPFGSLIQLSDGKLYGTTAIGGRNEYGVIFSFDPFSSTYTILKYFDGTNGATPQGSLMQASDGKLYGMTTGGGSKWYGVIFSFDPFSSTFTKLQDYNGANGASPYHNSFIEVKELNKAPIVKITSPANGANYTALATVLLSANAYDPDGKVKTVDFYNGDKLIFTETWPPFYRQWYNVPVGDYTITAKATDNKGLSTTSAPVHITVLGPEFLTANITNPGNGASFTAPATFTLTADVKGPNEIVKTDFYNGNTLIFTEHLFPYSNKWRNVPAGNYSVTAKATDSKGNVATSVPVAITVKSSVSATLVSNKPVSFNSKTNLRDGGRVQLMPNPANNILNIRTTGLQKNKQLIVSVISASGVIMQTKQFSSSTQTIELNVSSLVSGVYTIKFISGDRILYKQFVKL